MRRVRPRCDEGRHTQSCLNRVLLCVENYSRQYGCKRAYACNTTRPREKCDFVGPHDADSVSLTSRRIFRSYRQA